MVVIEGNSYFRIRSVFHVFTTPKSTSLRDWSLITGRGGGTKQEGGHVKFYPYEKGGRVLAMLKGGTKSFGTVFTW